MYHSDKKHFLFGFEVHAPWPKSFSEIQTLKTNTRYLALIFFDGISHQEIYDHIRYMPKPPFRVGSVAIADSLLHLPHYSPDIMTWHVDSFGNDPIDDYRMLIHEYLIEKGYTLERKKFIKHIAFKANASFNQETKKNFSPFPLYFSNLHLYENFKKNQYEPIWTYDLLPPFEEKKDGNFLLYGESFQQIFLNAQIALAFKFPDFIRFLDEDYQVRNLHDGGIRLTALINQAYREVKIPIERAIFPDNGQQDKGLLTWDLLVKYE